MQKKGLGRCFQQDRPSSAGMGKGGGSVSQREPIMDGGARRGRGEPKLHTITILALSLSLSHIRMSLIFPRIQLPYPYYFCSTYAAADICSPLLLSGIRKSTATQNSSQPSDGSWDTRHVTKRLPCGPLNFPVPLRIICEIHSRARFHPLHRQRAGWVYFQDRPKLIHLSLVIMDYYMQIAIVLGCNREGEILEDHTR